MFQLESEGGAVSKPFPEQSLPHRQPGPLHFRGPHRREKGAPHRGTPEEGSRDQAFAASRAPLPCAEPPAPPDSGSAQRPEQAKTPERGDHRRETYMLTRRVPAPQTLKWGQGQMRLETPGQAVTPELHTGRLWGPTAGQAVLITDISLQNHHGRHLPVYLYNHPSTGPMAH